MKLRLCLALLTITLTAQADEESLQLELDGLFTLVAQSNCLFIRNGSEHDAEDAADHMRLKSRRGKKYYDSTEQYIDRLATKSSWSGKAYSVQCPNQPPLSSNEWLHGLLIELRATPVADTK